MSKTMQGSFEETYHHIDAPTTQDNEWGKEHKQRKLTIPNKHGAYYRDMILYQLHQTGWQYKRKLDGENIRVRWDGEQALWNGKSNNFQCGANFANYMNDTFLEEIFEEKFGRDKKVILFGEHMGKKVQGNELGLDGEEFILYDVNIDGYWLDGAAIKGIATYFGVHTCYDFMGEGELCEFTGSLVNLIERVSKGDFKDWEGIVATPLVECRTQKGDRVIVKIKNRDYLREEE